VAVDEKFVAGRKEKDERKVIGMRVAYNMLCFL